MEEHMIAEINDDKKVIADLTITQLAKLQQITGGFIRSTRGSDEGQDEDHFIEGSVKMKKLKGLLERHNPPVIIFCKFLPEIEMIEEAIRRWYPDARIGVLTGKLKDTKTRKRRTNLLVRFQKGKIDYLISQFKTGGSGVDMFFADTGVMYSFTHSGIDNDQVFARMNHREKKTPPLMYRLVVKDSIDTDIIESLKSKLTTKGEFIKRLKKKGIKMPVKSPRKKKVSGDKPTPKKKATTKAKKASTKAKPKVSPKAKPSEKAPAFKYGAADVAKELDIDPASARAALRKAGVKKAGKSYGWNSSSDFKGVVKSLKG
jgi:superfamily II DNA or RNA helicase